MIENKRRRVITIDEMVNFEVDSETGSLYWKGKQIKTAKVITFNWWQKLGSFFVILSTVVMAIVSVLEYVQGCN